jgi:hypothetical protein
MITKSVDHDSNNAIGTQVGQLNLPERVRDVQLRRHQPHHARRRARHASTAATPAAINNSPVIRNAR